MRIENLTEAERESLTLLWRLGFLTSSQLSRLFSEKSSDRWAEVILDRLVRQGFVARTRRRPSWESQRGPRPYVHYLVGAGIYLAGSLWETVTKRSASKAYRQVCRETLLNHALLRNEYLAELAVAINTHDDGLILDFLAGERHAWRRAFPLHKKAPKCYPDGIAVIHKRACSEFELNVFIEAHTGSQDTAKTMANKVNAYCKDWSVIHAQVHGLGPRGVSSRVVFASPTERYAEQAYRLARTIEGDLSSDYMKLKRYSERHQDPADLFLFTDLDFIHGMNSALEEVYFSLCSGGHVSLLQD